MRRLSLDDIPAAAVVDDVKRTTLGWHAPCCVCGKGEPNHDAVRVTFSAPKERGWYDLHVHAFPCYTELLVSIAERAKKWG